MDVNQEKRAVFVGIVQNKAVLIPKPMALVPMPDRSVIQYSPPEFKEKFYES